MNDGLELVMNALQGFRGEVRAREVEWRELEARWRDRRADFTSRHGRNRALRREMMELLDAQEALEDYEQEKWFLMGLSLGLELGRLDPLRRE